MKHVAVMFALAAVLSGFLSGPGRQPADMHLLVFDVVLALVAIVFAILALKR